MPPILSILSVAGRNLMPIEACDLGNRKIMEDHGRSVAWWRVLVTAGHCLELSIQTGSKLAAAAVKPNDPPQLHRRTNKLR